ncbi:MAG TPA: AraC family transcriptional regulator ligand-binding domain-containing protein [Candidatus Acidoferrum sp.]|nr:AraC family transcriptional regulator ligand-binding domain-containing protein [Candidatus Acidoferrum sp.]
MREVRAASLTGFIEVSYYVGLDPFELLRRAKISSRFLDDPENRHAARPVTDMIEYAAAKSHCDAFGVLMAECRSFASLGPLSLLLERLPTVGHVLNALNEYRRLMNDVVSLECIQGVESTAFCWIVAPGFQRRQTIDLAVAVGYRILTEALGGRWAPEAVHFSHQSPNNLRIFQQFFGVPLQFDSSFSGYSCATTSLEARMPAAEPTMASHVRRLLDLIPIAREHMPVSDATQRAISLLLPSGAAQLTAVAANLGTNARTLQRRLALERTSFENLLNETRKDIAERLLITSRQPLAFIAEMVGYSSTSAFSRWFNSEFGQSPSTWRKAKVR